MTPDRNTPPFWVRLRRALLALEDHWLGGVPVSALHRRPFRLMDAKGPDNGEPQHVPRSPAEALRPSEDHPG